MAWARLLNGSQHVYLDLQTEREFRAWYVAFVRLRVRTAIWLPLILIAVTLCAGGPFARLRQLWFADNYPVALDIIRLGVILPWTMGMLFVVYTPLYRRWYTAAARFIAPIHGLCIVALDVMMRPQGYSLSSWMVLTLLSGYFMYGLLLSDAIFTVAITMTAYVFMGYTAHLMGTQWYVDFAAMIFAATFGGYVCYSLHQSVRRNYLDWRRLTDRVNRDALTGIHNRRKFDEHIGSLWQQAMRERASLGLLIIDIDHFKNYNDNLGHQAGDECLARIAKILAVAARRPLDLAARYGGEEFAILLYNADRHSLEELARSLQSEISTAAIVHPASPVQSYVTVSIGGASVLPTDGRSASGFVQLADEALYAAKDRGRNRIAIMDREYDTLKTGVFRSFKPRKEAIA
jgi:diguanylate cyclase (GGDEF)-like protein